VAQKTDKIGSDVEGSKNRWLMELADDLVLCHSDWRLPEVTFGLRFG